MNFTKKQVPVDLDAIDRELRPPLSLPKGPEAFAQPAVRAAHAMDRATQDAEAALVSPQVMSRAGELLAAAHKQLADQVRKACADEVDHALKLQEMGEKVALELEQGGKDLAVALSAQNNTVAAMFDEQKKFSARKKNLEEQILATNGGKKNNKRTVAEPELPPEPETP